MGGGGWEKDRIKRFSSKIDLELKIRVKNTDVYKYDIISTVRGVEGVANQRWGR